MLARDPPELRPASGLEDLLRGGNWSLRPEAAVAPVRASRSAGGCRAAFRRVSTKERLVSRPHAGAPAVPGGSFRAASGIARLPTRRSDLERADRSGTDTR